MTTNENELERFEAKLRGVRPARPPADFLQRLQSGAPTLMSDRLRQLVPQDSSSGPAPVRSSEPAARSFWLPLLLRWLVPATAVLAVGAIVWRANLLPGRGPESAGSPMK